jgi:hypothetical protein
VEALVVNVGVLVVIELAKVEILEELVVVDDELVLADEANSRILFNPSSLTHTFPDGSIATPKGEPMSVAVALIRPLEGAVTKSGCPRTRLAFSSLVKGGLNRSTLANPTSLAHNAPDLSKLKP